MLKKIIFSLILIGFFAIPTSAATVHTVVKGDTLWKIAQSYRVGLSELISVNTHIKNPDLIYVGNKITIPEKQSIPEAQAVVDLVNKQRQANGLKPLSVDWELARVAQYKAKDMHDNKYFSHTSPIYGSPHKMIKDFGISYKSSGENIAQGQKTANEVMNSWMNSSGHKANILGSYSHIGVGYVADGKYWVQMFILK